VIKYIDPGVRDGHHLYNHFNNSEAIYYIIFRIKLVSERH